jgi:hypothetical protein
MDEAEEQFERLLDYHGRRWPLSNGWSVEFRVKRVRATRGRPRGIKYSLTLHDIDNTRILGFDNAHGVARRIEWDHRHRFRDAGTLVPYKFIDADSLIADFMTALRQACAAEGVPFEFENEELVEEPDAFVEEE